MILSFRLAAAQLLHPSLRRFLFGGILGAASVFALLWAVVWWLLAGIDPTSLPLIGWLVDLSGGLFDWIAGFVIATTLGLVTFLLYPGVVVLIVSLFLDHVADAVEARHYPNLPPPRSQKLAEIVFQSMRFAGVLIALNILALPIYAVLFFLPPFNIVLFYLLNGYLIGREYFELVAFRRLDPAATRALRKSSRGSLLVAGAFLTLLMTIPIVNLCAPIFSAAFMTHLFHRLAGEKGMIVDRLS
jgi:uncharacterized protein involved in cysteine biosynthesis